MLKEFEVSEQQLEINFTLPNIELTSNIYPFPGDTHTFDQITSVLEFDRGSHFYISANSNQHIERYLTMLLQNKVNREDVYDWCYVHNFDNPDEPLLIKLKASEGSRFKQCIEKTICDIVVNVKELVLSNEFAMLEEACKDEAISKGEEELAALKKTAKKMGFVTHITDKGVFFVPVINGKKISEDDYDKLSLVEQERIIHDLEIIEGKSEQVMEKVKFYKEACVTEIKNKRKEKIQELVYRKFDKVYREHSGNEYIRGYLNCLKEDVYHTVYRQVLTEEIVANDKIKSLLVTEEIKSMAKYKVNHINCLKDSTTPVIYCNKANYYDLFGKLIYKTEQSDYVSNHELIEAGAFHKANGGYLILNVSDILRNDLIYEKIKKVLVSNTLVFDSIRERYGAMPLKTIKPEPMPMNVTVILIGSSHYYRKICEIDEEFNAIFGSNIEIKASVDINKRNIMTYLAYFKQFSINNTCMKCLLKYAVKLSGNRKKLSTDINKFDRILRVSNNYANKMGHKKITEECVKESINYIDGIYQQYNQYNEELFQDELLIVKVTGYIVGQMNGLAITNYVDYELARPIRITGTVSLGTDKVISIEDKNKLSGKIFSKGISIINGYLNDLFFEDEDFGYECSICFEQVYGGIDGDSAICAQLCVILSAFSKIPINQSIAITGAMDQLGNVQPVGGVSTKIEGYYNTCKILGFTGEQGVIIPRRNMHEVIMNDEILKAIKEGKFHLYAVDKIEEVIKILMNKTIEEVVSTILSQKKQKTIECNND